MQDFKRFLARPTRLPLVLLVGTIVLIVTVLVQGSQTVHPAAGEHFPWVSLFIAAVIVLLLGVMTFLRSFAWMHREYPEKMHEIDTARRMAVRQADSGFSKWMASQRHTPVPLVVVVLGWVFAGVIASGVVLFATGILH